MIKLIKIMIFAKFLKIILKFIKKNLKHKGLIILKMILKILKKILGKYIKNINFKYTRKNLENRRMVLRNKLIGKRYFRKNLKNRKNNYKFWINLVKKIQIIKNILKILKFNFKFL